MKDKATNKRFKCDWCDNEQEHTLLANQSIKPTMSHGQIICTKCGRYISQKWLRKDMVKPSLLL